MLSEFDSLCRQRDDLAKWMSLGGKIAEYDRKKFQLRVDLNTPSTVAYCGQMCCGGQNYHNAPKWFLNAVKRELDLHAHKAVSHAYQTEMERLDSEIEKHRSDVLKALGCDSKDLHPASYQEKRNSDNG